MCVNLSCKANMIYYCLLQISNEHIPTPSAIIYDEQVLTHHHEREGQVREQYDDFRMKRRRLRVRASHVVMRRALERSQQQLIIDERRARAIQAKSDMKQAVKSAKAAGKAIEYRGPLSRATIVSCIFKKRNGLFFAES